MKSRHILFLAAFLLILSVRFLYHRFHPAYGSFPDSSHYALRAQQIGKGEPLVSHSRTPGYPLFIRATTKLDGNIVQTYTDIFRYSYYPLIAWQGILGIAGGIFFLLLVWRTFNNHFAFILLAVLFAFDITVFAWERVILPEATIILFLAMEKFNLDTQFRNIGGIPTVVWTLWSVSGLLVVKYVYEVLPENIMFRIVRYLGKHSMFIFLFHYAILTLISENVIGAVTLSRFMVIIGFAIGFSLLVRIIYKRIEEQIIKIFLWKKK